MTKKLEWFRMYSEFATDPLVQSLSFDDQRHFVIVLCLKASGVLDKDLSPTVRETVIRRSLGLETFPMQEAKRRLMECGIIDDNWQPVNWDKRQYVSDSSTSRVQAFRKRQRNVSVTPPETETETETEKTTKPNGLVVETPPSSDPPSSPTDADNDARDAASTASRCPTRQIVALYDELLPMLPRVAKLTTARRAQIQQRWREDLPTVDDWRDFFLDVAKSPFLTGRCTPHDGRTPFRATLPWLTKAENFAKISEGRYHDGVST